MEIIRSVQNARIKQLKKLDKSSERKEQQLFLIEGLREIVLAKRAGYTIDTLFICEELLSESEEYSTAELADVARKISITREVYESVAYRETTEGVLATAKQKQHSITQLQLPPNPLILIIEAVEKPGNLGAMLRTSDAAHADAVIICDPKTDVYNPNVIRSSIGTVFTTPIAIATTQEAINFLRESKIEILAAELNATSFYYQQPMDEAVAIAVGTEANGLSKEWIEAATARIKIPMLGEIDSLNVSVSAAILLYEAVRQRNTKK